MNEKQLLVEISHLASQSRSFADAVDDISALLEEHLSGRGLVVTQVEDAGLSGVADSVERFFEETADLPCRSLYTAALRANGREIGRMVAFFAGADSPDRIRQRVTTFAGEQLGVLLERIRLARRRRLFHAEIARIRVNLTARKALQRAEGVLIRRGFDSTAARSWVRNEAIRQGVSVTEISNRLFEQEMAFVPEPVSVPIGLSA